ncbi:MAG TPA: FAD/NAD(P)-binding protein [Gammaproteobacteria bacterium]|nr:FAD/NAD(P)-binding protein [Gammaproteobacteria bacterium]
MTKKIAIIGAGFSGAATAIQLLTRHGHKPFEVMLINRHANLARGVAYGTHSPLHLLNVPAGRMSVFPDREDDFLEFARAADAAVTASDFVRRSCYGKYLHTRLDQAAAAAGQARLNVVTGEVTVLRLDRDGAVLDLSDGRKLYADRVVLAVGHYPPADPPVPDHGVFAGANYVRDPWAPGAFDQLPLDKPILLLGTGLTMVDVALDLDQRGYRGTLMALSRHGLLPQAHRTLRAMPQLEPPAELLAGAASARAYLHAVRAAVAASARHGRDWRDVIGALRPVTPALWQTLARNERRRFLRHLQAYWDSHRHRTAPVSARRLAQLLAGRRLAVRAGRLLELRPLANGIQAVWRPRGQIRSEPWRGASLINCTGPESRLSRLADPLIRGLLAGRLLTADPLELGVATDDEGALLDNAGRASRVIYYTGPLLRARDWECTAVPELRLAALRLADRLAGAW